MKAARPPRVEIRRAKELEAELFARARAWLPAWGMHDDERDFGRALLKIAARFASEVAERLDRAGEKLRLGFLDWLAVSTEAARPARLPVVFKLADSAREAKLATAPTRLQVEAAGASVMLETEKDMLLVPRGLQVVVGVDAATDAFFLPTPGLSSLAPLEPLPTQWQLKSFASAGATQVQLDPEQGLAVDMLIVLAGQQYRITKVDKDIVTLDPPLTQDQREQSTAAKVTAFMPFDGAARNRQEHGLYIGHKELFNIEAAATIEILGAKSLTGVAWHYWGKVHPKDEVDWQSLRLASADEQAKSEGIVLEKPKGAIEVLELVKGKESRWIRASVATVKPEDRPLLIDALEIRINCGHGGTAPPSDVDAAAAAPSAEAMSNTTPLVLDGVFFPFGKEPRQFDAFYLGSKEAFSKKDANLVLDFEMADTTFMSLAAVRSGAFKAKVLAGVARDGSLYLLEPDATSGIVGRFRERTSLRPPPTDGNTDVSAGQPLDLPLGRLPVWHDSADVDGFLVAVSVRDAVWVWREPANNAGTSGWVSFGSVPARAPRSDAQISDLIYFDDTATLFALRGEQLSRRKWLDVQPWTPVKTETSDVPAKRIILQAIVPILTESAGSLVTSTITGMIGISSDDERRLYLVSQGGVCKPLDPMNVNANVRPVAVLRGADLFVAFFRESQRKPAMLQFKVDTQQQIEKPIEIDEENAEVKGFDAVLSAGVLHFLASVQFVSGGYLASWSAPVVGTIDALQADIPASLALPVGAPTQILGRVAIPGTGGRVLAAPFDVAKRFELRGDVGEAVFAQGPRVLGAEDFLAREIPGTTVVSEEWKIALRKPRPKFSVASIKVADSTAEAATYYLLKKPFAPTATGALYGFRQADERNGAPADPDKLTLDPQDSTVGEGAVILMKHGTHRKAHLILQITVSGGLRIATLDSAPPAAGPTGTVPYLNGHAVNGHVSPFVKLQAPSNAWPATLLEHATLRFAGAAPVQRGTAFKLSGTKPELIELSSPWTLSPVPDSGVEFLLDAAAGLWTISLDPTAANPDLSWEYWNGAGWWKLIITRDETLRLKVSGKIEFKVPPDLAPTDWSGRTNHWIRARLVGGDYGREKVSVKTSKPDPKDGSTEQTIIRSTEDIHAPSVVKLTISYAICENVLPDFVLTKDSGSLRDQSDANRTGGAKVEAFVPLAVLLGRLSGPLAVLPVGQCRPDCRCPSGTTADTATTAASPAPRAVPDSMSPTAATTITAAGRAVYLGFDAPLLGEPINVMLLVEERRHDEFAPMTVEALIADRFVPIVIADATRALGESGVLSMAFPVEPTPRELFGQTLKWLRLTPAGGESAADWKPKVLGAYLNGVWASAAETLTRELVGSSQGEPNLTLYLARPPVLRNTLELHVKEPLGEEEIAALNSERADQVLTAVEGLPGNWVLWNRVIDPADEAPTARVYALDEATGEIRFGDGRHGKIPPVGRDSIVAFTYRRTESGAPGSDVVPGNAITARTTLNLVSPIEGVEAVLAADQAACGALPEDTERVLRFGVAGLRHRARALMPRDIEDLVLASSPDVAQARCFPRNGFVQLVVVMRGANPMPRAAQVRELHRLLLDAAPPSLGARQALRIRGPRLRRLRVELRLRVASLDDAGAVARDARKQIFAFFDTATGGVDGEGWALGDNPSEGDIAVALANIPRMEGIVSVAPREIADDGSDQPWPAALKRSELARLEKDGVRIEFETVEVVA